MTLVVGADGRLSPPTLSVPPGVTLDLRLTDHDRAAHTVLVATPGRPAVALKPSARLSVSVPRLRHGTYRILVDGSPAGLLLVGTEGGP